MEKRIKRSGGLDGKDSPEKMRAKTLDFLKDASSSYDDNDENCRPSLLTREREEGEEVAEEATNREDSKSNLGFGYFGNDPSKKANVWVLCINNQFKEFGRESLDPRIGSEADVKNLRETFTNRGCNFQELSCKSKNEILNVFSSEQNLLKFFNPQDSINSQGRRPTMFILFILSHGTLNGRVFTDHLLVAGADKNKIKDPNEVESYLVSDLWDGLKSMSLSDDCLFLLMLGACRGGTNEMLYGSDECSPMSPQPVGENTCRLLADPNRKNFVIFYASVESTPALRHVKDGTNLVRNFCKQLNNLHDHQPLEVFLTELKRRMFNFTSNSGQVQTPELRIFPSPQFIILGDEKKQDEEYDPDDEPSGRDFEWSPKTDENLVRGRALFCGRNSKIKNSFKTAFINLEFNVEECARTGLMETMTSAATKNFLTDQALVVCFLTEICEENQELCINIKNGNTSEIIPIKHITNKFIGSNCRAMVGKPKIFLFLDISLRADSFVYPETKAAKLNEGSNHSGIYIIVATSDKVVGDILAGLRSLLLRNGGSLQEVMVAAISKHQGSQIKIIPQITSTLQWLLYFHESLEADVDPILKENNRQASNKIVTINNKSVASTSLQSDSVTFVTGADVNHEIVANRLAQRMSTATPEFDIVKLRIDDILEYVKSADFELASELSVIQYFLELESDKNLSEPQSKSDAGATQSIDSQALCSKIESLATSQLNFSTTIDKIGQKKVVIFLFCSVFYDIEASKCIQKLLQKLYKLHIPLIIAVTSHDLKCLKEVTCNESKLISYVGVMPQNKNTIIQKMKAKLKWSSAQCHTLLDELDYSKDAMVLANADHFSLLMQLLENNLTVKGNLFQLYELYFSLIINTYLKSENDLGENSTEFISGVLSQAALLMYGDSISKLYTDELTLLGKFNNHITVLASGQIKFANTNLADFLVARKLVLSHSDTKLKLWKSKFSWEEILTQHRFRGVRCFVNSFLNWTEMPPSINLNLKKLTAKLSEIENKNNCLLMTCEEGNYKLFKVISSYSLERRFQKENLNQYLRLACRSHERLALTLLRHGADIWSVLEKYREEGLLHGVAALGSCDFMKKLLSELEKGKKSDLQLTHIPGSSLDEDFFPTTPEVCISEFVRNVINARDKMGCAAIHCAAENGHTEMVNILLAYGANATLCDNLHNQWTALHYAVLNGHEETTQALLQHVAAQPQASPRLLLGDLRLSLDLLLEKGSNPTTKKHDNWIIEKKFDRTLYEDFLAFVVEHRVKVISDVLLGRNTGFLAVQEKRSDILKILQKTNEDIFTPDLAGDTLLHKAAEVGNLEAILTLKDKIPVDAKNKLTQTPLDIAASKTQTEALIALLEHGAVPTMMTLFYAALRVDKQSCELLLEAGAPFADAFGDTVMHRLTLTGTINALKLMVELGANPCAVDNERNTPLHLAVGRTDGMVIVEYLLALGVPVDAQTVEGRTPLHIACKRNAENVAKLLLDHGADKDQCDVHNFNALHHSAGSYNCFKLLMSRGIVIVEAQTDGNKTVIDLAEMKGSVRVLNALHRWLVKRRTGRERILITKIISAKKRLREIFNKMHPPPPKRRTKKRNTKSIHDAAEKRNWIVMKKLLDKGVSVNAENSDKQTPLHIAVESKSSTIVKMLLEQPDVKVNAQDFLQETPLHYAAQNQGQKIAKLLIENGGNIHAPNLRKLQPLHLAIECENAPLVLMLLEKRADINSLSADGSPLHIAAEKRNSEFLKMLLEKSADRGALDEKGATPLHRAAAAGLLQNIIILLQDGGEKYLKAVDHIGNTPAHLAAFNNFQSIVDYLQNQGADVDAKNYKLQTPTKIDDSPTRKRVWQEHKTGLLEELGLHESDTKRQKQDQPGPSKK